MEYEAFDVKVIATSDKAAYLEFHDYDDEQIWIPFSQIEDNGEDLVKGYDGEVYITTWIAEQKGLL